MRKFPGLSRDPRIEEVVTIFLLFVNLVDYGFFVMVSLNPVLIDVPMPLRTPRLLIRPKQIGDGARTSAAVAESWDELHKWMR